MKRTGCVLMALFSTSTMLCLVGATGCGGGGIGQKKMVFFDGHSLAGWQPLNPANNTWIAAAAVEPASDNPAQFSITPGEGILVNGPQGQTSNIYSDQQHGDCKAHIEFMIPRGSNSGVYLMGKYEIQVFDSFGKEKVDFADCGGIYARWINEQNVDGYAPRVNASKPPGEWQTFDVVFRAPRFDAAGTKIANACFVKVVHNGQVVHENVEMNGPTRAALKGPEQPTGPLMLQGDHGPVAYRNICIRPLGPQ